MNEEDYKGLKQMFENGRLIEIKKIKKESLIDFIKETEKRIKQKNLENSNELETAKLCIENFEENQKTIKEYQDLIAELKYIYNDLQEKFSEINKKLNWYKKFKNRIIAINILIVIIILIISFL